MSSAATSSTVFNSPDQQQHLLSPTDQLCYVHCNFCDTVLAVSVPCSSLFKTVTVRCGHCSNLLSVNMRTLLLPPPNNNNQLHLPHPFFSTPHNLLEESRNTPSNTTTNHQPNYTIESAMPIRGGGFDHHQEIPKPPAVVNRRNTEKKKRQRSDYNVHLSAFVSLRNVYIGCPAPEKRQRVPSAYNRFIKEEIQRIKAGNPDISHREAFSAAAKNWAHFPHIHFGLLPDEPVKKTNIRQQEGDDVLMKDGFFSTPANVGVSPY